VEVGDDALLRLDEVLLDESVGVTRAVVQERVGYLRMRSQTPSVNAIRRWTPASDSGSRQDGKVTIEKNKAVEPPRLRSSQLNPGSPPNLRRDSRAMNKLVAWHNFM